MSASSRHPLVSIIWPYKFSTVSQIILFSGERIVSITRSISYVFIRLLLELLNNPVLLFYFLFCIKIIQCFLKIPLVYEDDPFIKQFIYIQCITGVALFALIEKTFCLPLMLILILLLVIRSLPVLIKGPFHI